MYDKWLVWWRYGMGKFKISPDFQWPLLFNLKKNYPPYYMLSTYFVCSGERLFYRGSSYIVHCSPEPLNTCS